MLHVHTIGRIGKDCQVIAGAHGSFMAMNIAVDDYSKGQNVTTWVKVRSNKENHGQKRGEPNSAFHYGGEHRIHQYWQEGQLGW